MYDLGWLDAPIRLGSLVLAFFGGMLGVGIARPLDRRPDWELVWSIGGVL